jgi:hypothetical protein
VRLTPDEVRELDEAVPPGAAIGTRYGEAMVKTLNR